VDLHLTQESIRDGVKRPVHLRNITGHQPVEIFFDLVGTNAPPQTILDAFIFGIVFFAMRLGQDVRVHGPVSLDALLSLNEFQEAWVLWKPQIYKKIKILPETVVERVSTR
jgi:hypothetical protein